MQKYIQKIVVIKKIVRENKYVCSYSLDYSVSGKPGQFVNVWIPGLDEKPISIADNDGKTLLLTISEVGPFSKAMAKMKPGDKVGIRGPYGKGFQWKKKQHLIMVAGGYGAAPLYFTAKMAARDGCMVDFILGARSKEYLLYESKLKQLSGLKLYIATDDGSKGHKGYNVEVLEKMFDEVPCGRLRQRKMGQGGRKVQADMVRHAFHDICVMTCGPEIMMKKVSDICFAHKIPAQISVERYMKCGFGVCGQCCVDDSGIPTCKNGPVMSNSQVRKIKEFGVYHRDDVGRKVYY